MLSTDPYEERRRAVYGPDDDEAREAEYGEYDRSLTAREEDFNERTRLGKKRSLLMLEDLVHLHGDIETLKKGPLAKWDDRRNAKRDLGWRSLGNPNLHQSESDEQVLRTYADGGADFLGDLTDLSKKAAERGEFDVLIDHYVDHIKENKESIDKDYERKLSEELKEIRRKYSGEELQKITEVEIEKQCRRKRQELTSKLAEYLSIIPQNKYATKWEKEHKYIKQYAALDKAMRAIGTKQELDQETMQLVMETINDVIPSAKRGLLMESINGGNLEAFDIVRRIAARRLYRKFGYGNGEDIGASINIGRVNSYIRDNIEREDLDTYGRLLSIYKAKLKH